MFRPTQPVALAQHSFRTRYHKTRIHSKTPPLYKIHPIRFVSFRFVSPRFVFVVVSDSLLPALPFFFWLWGWAFLRHSNHPQSILFGTHSSALLLFLRRGERKKRGGKIEKRQKKEEKRKKKKRREKKKEREKKKRKKRKKKETHARHNPG